MAPGIAVKKLLICLIFFTAVPFSGYAAEKKNVLILNSYHQGYKWTDDETRGIINGLFPEQGNIKTYIEYMGTKWIYNSDYLRELSILYKKKFTGIIFDVIISTDDDAFNFLKQYRNDVFGAVPVVFCGINWITPGKLKGMTFVSGVNETTDISLNLYLMKKIHPDVEKIFVIIDSTTTGVSVYNKLLEIMPQYKGIIDIIPLYNLSMARLINIVSSLDNKSLVLLTIFSRDGDGKFFEFNEFSSLISSNSLVPVYGLWDFKLGHGIIGGNLASGYTQGITAGNIALRVLKGEHVDSIPVVMDSPNTYMFDYSVMKRFGIGRDVIPSSSIIINEPSPFYSINKHVFQFILILTAAFALFSAILVINIKRRYSAERGLSESEERYRTLVNNLNAGVFRSSGSDDGFFISANPAMLKIFGYQSEEEFLGIPVKTLYVDSLDRKRFIENLISAGFVNCMEIPVKKKDGSTIIAEISGTASFNETGDKLLWVDGILEDITEKKKLEQELRHAQKMDTIGTIASGIAHDFNNSLGGLIGIVSIVDHKIRSGVEIPSEKLLEYISIMKDSGNRGAAMVKRLLTLAKKKEAELSPADLNSIIKRVVDLLNGVIDKSVIVNPVYSEGPAVIQADADQIEQALLNLCLNAGHAMTIMREEREEWGGILTIAVSRILADRYICRMISDALEKEYWSIAVTDTGIGMTEEIKQNIFEPFFTTKDDGIGTGLGLSMVKKIVTEHRGFIDVYSEHGVGTTFKIHLPVSTGVPYYTEQSDLIKMPAGHGIILLVEDELLIRMAASEMLKESGFNVITADNGEEAIEICREKYKDIRAVVLDMSMPVMSGIAAYRELREIYPDVKVLITSGFSQDKRVEEAIALGASGFIEKPYTLEKLAHAVIDII